VYIPLNENKTLATEYQSYPDNKMLF